MNVPLLALRDISVALDGRPVLGGVSLDLRRGEIVTVVGPNGSGKSTLLRLMAGALLPDAGRIERAAGLKLGYAPQTLRIEPSLPLSVDRFLALPRRDAGAGAALARVGLSGLGRRPLAALSGGQFQRALLARAILGRPDLLLLDEPTQGLDQPGQAAFYRLIEELRAEIGCAVVMVSHELHVVMSGSDRVICLNGHICCEGTPEVVSAAPAYRALFGTGTGGALAIYRHEHDHDHGHEHGHHAPEDHARLDA